MAKNKIKLDLKGFEEYLLKIDGLGGNVKEITNKCLKETKKLVTENLEADTNPGNYPSGGRYSQGDTKEAINKELNVSWEGLTGSVEVGFDMEKPGGVTSIFLMYGTPRHAPNHPGTAKAEKIYDDIYGAKRKKEVSKLQEKILSEEISKLMR